MFILSFMPNWGSEIALPILKKYSKILLYYNFFVRKVYLWLALGSIHNSTKTNKSMLIYKILYSNKRANVDFSFKFCQVTTPNSKVMVDTYITSGCYNSRAA